MLPIADNNFGNWRSKPCFQSLPGLCHLLFAWCTHCSKVLDWGRYNVKVSCCQRTYQIMCTNICFKTPSRYASSLFYNSWFRNLGHCFPKLFLWNLVFRDVLRGKKSLWENNLRKIAYNIKITMLNALISPSEKKTTCFVSISPIFFSRKCFPFAVKLINPMEWRNAFWKMLTNLL